MNSEELTQEKVEDPLKFDAHEFDGLREALEKEAEGIFARVDEYIRENPWACMGIAAAAGFAAACVITKSSSRTPAEAG
jgi:ElaB/YqjD/DUF883 family membrane-anchored ribosome-binding protein